MISCNENRNPEYKTGVGVRVEIPSGQFDLHDESETQIPYIFNKAVIPNLNDESIEFLVLSEHLKKNEFLQTQPIGVMQLLDKKSNQKHYVILAVPSSGDYKRVRINNFNDLNSKHYFIKQIVESWYLNKDGMGSKNLISWEDENYASNLINRKMRTQG